MVLTGNHRQLLGAAAGFLLDELQREPKIFLGGGSSLLLPNPLRWDAPVCEPGVHTQSLGDILSAALPSGNHTLCLRIRLKIRQSRLQTLFQRGGGLGSIDPCAQHHYIGARRVFSSPCAGEYQSSRYSHKRQDQTKATGKQPPHAPGRGRMFAPQAGQKVINPHRPCNAPKSHGSVPVRENPQPKDPTKRNQ